MNSALMNTKNGSPICSDDYLSSNESTSIHSALIDEVYDIPMKEISRPLPSVLNEDKVQSLIETIQVIIKNHLIIKKTKTSILDNEF
jgi:hypothetical protein